LPRNQPRILIIEDQPGQGSRIAATLERLGYSSVTLAPSEQGALKAAKGVVYDIALIFSNLTGARDGFAFADCLLQECSLPAIFLSAAGDKLPLEQIGRYAGYACLREPVDGFSLHATIQLTLKRHGAFQKLKAGSDRYKYLWDKFINNFGSKNDQLIDAFEQLIESHIIMQTVVDAAPGILMVLDSQGNIHAANRTAAKELRVPLSDVVGSNISAYLSERMTAKSIEMLREVSQQRQIKKTERRHQGRVFRFTLFPVCDAKTRDGLVGVFSTDLTSQRQTEVALQERLRLETLLAELSAGFVKYEPRDFNRVLESGLEALRKYLGASRASLVQQDEEDNRYVLSHVAVGGSLPGMRGTDVSPKYPWFMERMAQGSPLVLANLPGDLPPEAASLSSAVLQAGLKSHLGVPLFAAGKFIGALGFDFYGKRARWPRDITQRIGPAANIFAAALARQKAEQLSQISKRRLELATQAGNVGIWDLHVPSCTPRFNDEWFRMLGYEPGELPQIYDTWVNLLHPDDRDETLKLADLMMAGKLERYKIQFRMRAKDGSWRWILSTGKIMERDALGNPIWFLGTHLEITAQKQAEQSLKEHRDLLQERVAEKTTELEARIKELNYLYGVASLISCHQEIETSDLVMAVCRLLSDSLSEHQGVWVKACYDGNEYYAAEPKPGGIPLLQASLNVWDRPVGSIQIGHDMAQGGPVNHLDLKSVEPLVKEIAARVSVFLEARTAEVALAASEERYRNLVENSPYGVFVVVDGLIDFVNQAGIDLLGAKGLHEVTGRAITDFLPWYYCKIGLLMESFATEAGEGLPLTAQKIKRLDNVLIDAEIAISPLKFQGVSAVQAIIHDISERRAAEERLLEHQRQLRALAAKLSQAEEQERRRIARDLHDKVCQSLALAAIRVKQYDQKQPSPEHKDILRDVLDLIMDSLADTRTLLMEISPPILYDLGLGAALELLAETISDDYGLTVVLDAPKDEIPIPEAQRAVLYQCTRELIINAAKHAKTDRVEVRLEQGMGEETTICVRDRGNGMELDFGMPKKRPKDSFGLINIAERIKHLGGTMKIESEPMKGAEVVITLTYA
jgi:PAS domain S-box-containing protein